MAIHFEWDETKALANKAKHGVSFRSALAVFLDAHAPDRHDKGDHTEDRFVTLGLVQGYLLVVVYTLRHDAVRLISAREATRHEAIPYWKHRSIHARP